MPRRSRRRTISDDIYCMNTASIFIRLSTFILCFWPIIMGNAAITKDTNPNLLSILGLPRKNHCAIYYNNTLFILEGQSIEPSLAITFTNDSSTRFPSIQWIENKHDVNKSSSASICTVTSYGQAIIFHPILQNNDTIDLNTMNWTLTSSSSPINFTTVAATIMKDDTILVLGHNNNNSSALSTWILDASDDQLQWTWTQLTVPSPLLLTSALISASMITTTSYILYFGVTQPISMNIDYNVSVYCFDISSLTWTGSLLNFTSTTNHIQPVMINNNTKNDTLLIIPDWIDTTIIHATSSNINVTNAEKKNQQIQQQQHQQQHQHQHQHKRQQQLVDIDGFWILNIDVSLPSSSSLPLIDLAWQPSVNNFEPINGGSATLVGNNVIFYGGQDNNNSNSSSGMNFQLRFWNVSNHSFLPTPAWLVPLLPSSSPPPPPPLSTSSNAADTNGTTNDNNKVIIILATLLGIFGLAFLWLLGLFLWRRKKEQQQNDGTTTRQIEQGGASMTAHQHNTPRIDQHDNAATWAEQLQRSFSTILQRLRSASSPTQKKPIPAISAPLEATHPTTMNHQQQDIDQRTLQQQQQQQQQQDMDLVPSPVSTTTTPVAAPPMSSSNLSNSAPQSTRNSWREGSLKASRFVEHF